MGLVGDTACVLATQSVFFLIGWIFFVKKLFKDYELRHYLVQVRTTRGFFTLLKTLKEKKPKLFGLWPKTQDLFFKNLKLLEILST